MFKGGLVSVLVSFACRVFLHKCHFPQPAHLEGWLKKGLHVDIQGNVPVVKGWGSGYCPCIFIDLLVHTVLLIEGS